MKFIDLQGMKIGQLDNHSTLNNGNIHGSKIQNDNQPLSEN